MSGLLASINSLQEAKVILDAQVDIIDLKQPELGALGALEIKQVVSIVNFVNHRVPLSATIGDLPMQADLLVSAVREMAETGVDYIKIGFFPRQDWYNAMTALQTLTPSLKLIAVLFADQNPSLKTIERFAQAGFSGIMLDTMDKQKGSLMQVMPLTEIKYFVQKSKELELLCGLAGSLRLEDIKPLLALMPDYLGFRGALCANHLRVAKLDSIAVKAVRVAVSDHSFASI